MGAPLKGVDWEAAKAALAMGAKIEDVAQDMGIKWRSLQKRAQRGNWLVAHTALKKAAIARKINPNASGSPLPDTSTQAGKLMSLPGIRVSNLSRNDDFSVESREKGGALVLQTLERNDERISVLASGMALKSVENASRRKKALPINTVQDLDKAVMISKRAAGKDRDDSKVTVALFGGQGAAAGPMEDAAKRFRVRIAESQVT